MSDQAGPFTEDTPAVAGPEGTSGPAEQQAAEVDWQKRYSDLQPEYTRTSQEAAQLREREQYYALALTSEDPDIRRQALEALGYELDEEVEQPAYDDPYDNLQAQYQRLEQRVDQRDQEAQEAQQTALIRAVTDDRLAALGDLDEADQDWVLAYAINALPALHEPELPVPVPDIRGAYDVFRSREVERQKTWAKTKRAPYVSPGGQTATEVPNLDTHQGRMDFAAQKLMELEERQ